MDALLSPTDVHRQLAKDLIAKASAAVVDELVAAVCARLRASEHHETGHPSDLERVARLLRAFETSVHLPAIIYDALDSRRVMLLVVHALDRLAIDGSQEEVNEVAAAAERFLDAVREPALVSTAGPSRR